MKRHLLLTVIAGFCAVLAHVSVACAADSRQPHEHKHAHDHAHAVDDRVYKGYFEDQEVRPRALSDWEGEWQSVYPYLKDGTLDPVFAHKAAHGDKSVDQYSSYYEKGYRTDVQHITIEGDRVTFERPDHAVSAIYVSDGHEILTYARGNRGVRYVFTKVEGDTEAPDYIQFSDHRIAPERADHFHLYWGNDRAVLLQEMEHWPTYYPKQLSGAQIAAEMMKH